uniref:Uncharacterized protein n=2 Tax=Aegilops tauschii subsp. strangulata TaxID=200361 RepID=A0A453B4R6_AEGTS
MVYWYSTVPFQLPSDFICFSASLARTISSMQPYLLWGIINHSSQTCELAIWFNKPCIMRILTGGCMLTFSVSNHSSLSLFCRNSTL